MMRLALTTSLLALTLAPCWAQSTDFNPYQAVLDGMPLAEAEPLIVASLGPILHRNSGIAQPYDGGPILVLSTGEGVNLALFLFCEEELTGFVAPITPKAAAQILGPLTSPDADSVVYAADDGISVYAMDYELTVSYLGVGTKASMVQATYPRAMLGFNYAKRCASLTD
jgi:hypothetical protein